MLPDRVSNPGPLTYESGVLPIALRGPAVARCYLWLFMLYINIKIGKKKLLNVRLTGDHLYGKLLFTWLSLVMSMMVSFCAVLFPTRCLG